MVTTLFWGRLRAELDEATSAEYAADVDQMKELAAGSGGFVSYRIVVGETLREYEWDRD